jgi:hypothetical protein
MADTMRADGHQADHLAKAIAWIEQHADVIGSDPPRITVEPVFAGSVDGAYIAAGILEKIISQRLADLWPVALGVAKAELLELEHRYRSVLMEQARESAR